MKTTNSKPATITATQLDHVVGGHHHHHHHGYGYAYSYAYAAQPAVAYAQPVAYVPQTSVSVRLRYR